MKMKEIKLKTAKHKLYGKLGVVGTDRPTIVLLSGLGFHTFEYETISSLLLSKGYNCLSFDFCGHGRSEGKRGDWVIQDLVDDTNSWINYIYTNLNDKIGIYGNSLGAMVAVAAATQDSRIKSVIASNCPAHLSDYLLTPFRRILFSAAKILSVFVPFRISVNHFYSYQQLINNPDWVKTIESDELVKDARKLKIIAYKSLLEGWDGKEIVKQVSQPLLILQGKNDKLQPLSQSEILFESANRNKELKFVDTGHLPHLEKPELLSNIITEWFDKTLK